MKRINIDFSLPSCAKNYNPVRIKEVNNLHQIVVVFFYPHKQSSTKHDVVVGHMIKSLIDANDWRKSTIYFYLFWKNSCPRKCVTEWLWSLKNSVEHINSIWNLYSQAEQMSTHQAKNLLKTPITYKKKRDHVRILRMRRETTTSTSQGTPKKRCITGKALVPTAPNSL